MFSLYSSLKSFSLTDQTDVLEELFGFGHMLTKKFWLQIAEHEKGKLLLSSLIKLGALAVKDVQGTVRKSREMGQRVIPYEIDKVETSMVNQPEKRKTEKQHERVTEICNET